MIATDSSRQNSCKSLSFMLTEGSDFHIICSLKDNMNQNEVFKKSGMY